MSEITTVGVHLPGAFGATVDRAVPSINYNENHDLATARSSSSRADPGLRVAFKCLNI